MAVATAELLSEVSEIADQLESVRHSIIKIRDIITRSSDATAYERFAPQFRMLARYVVLTEEELRDIKGGLE